MNYFSWKKQSVVGLVLVFLGGCATPPVKQAIFLHPHLNTKNVGSVTVVPVLDRRIDKSAELDLGDVADQMKSLLEKKGYKSQLADKYGSEEIYDMTLTAINEADSSWAMKIGPRSARWILLVAVTEAERKITLQATAHAEVVGYLYNQAIGERMWKDKGEGIASMGLLFSAVVDDWAVEMAVDNMMKSFPRK